MLEFILTALLMFVILSVSTGAKEKGIMAGAAIGAVVALEAMSRTIQRSVQSKAAA